MIFFNQNVMKNYAIVAWKYKKISPPMGFSILPRVLFSIKSLQNDMENYYFKMPDSIEKTSTYTIPYQIEIVKYKL